MFKPLVHNLDAKISIDGNYSKGHATLHTFIKTQTHRLKYF
jgi:hypothetical protein